MWPSEDYMLESVLCYHMGLRDQTQVVRLSGKHLNPVRYWARALPHISAFHFCFCSVLFYFETGFCSASQAALELTM